jgi:UDP-2,4-diacetamido-2,4,6-trideoxy-beta-L-altropyranose hydrolase
MSKAVARVLVRVDGGAAVGLGHVTRCLALAERLQARGAVVTFVTRSNSEAVLARIRAGGCETTLVPDGLLREDDASFLLERVRSLVPRAVVTDSYEVTTGYQRVVRSSGVRLVVVDDLAREHFVADVVLNQNIGACAGQYSAEPYTRLLLGPRYALLRHEFWASRPLARQDGAMRRVLITMGGSDPGNLTSRALVAVDAVPDDLVVDVVVGPAFTSHEELTNAVAGASHPVRVHRDPPNLAEIMAEATLAVSAAGSTCWELAFLGVPAALLVAADNQTRIAEGLAAAGFALSLGAAAPFPTAALRDAVGGLLDDSTQRARMARAGRSLVDGRGTDRVADEVLAA